MRPSLRSILLGIAVSGLQHGVHSRVLPRAGTTDPVCKKDSCLVLPAESISWASVIAVPTPVLNDRGLKAARFEIEPPVIPKPEPITVEPPSTHDPTSEPLTPGEPSEPQSPEKTAGSGPIEFTSVGPQVPTVAPTKKAPPPTATEHAPSATPAKSGKPIAPAATGAPDGNTDVDPITSSTPGGLSGDHSEDSGGFGDGPHDDECLLGSRDATGLGKRCSRLKRPAGWTAYDDMAAGVPDKPHDALKAAIKDNTEDEEAPSYKPLYQMRGREGSFKDIVLNTLPKNAKTEDIFASKDQDKYQLTYITNQRSTKDVHTSAISPDGTTIVALYSSADNDAKKVLTWSEFTFQRYSEVAAGNVKELSSIVRSEVSNPHTINTIRAAYTKLGKDFGDENDKGPKVVLHANAPTGSAELAAFEALMRTDNVRGVNWMLADHHRALGDKQITSITIWPDGQLGTAILISVGRT